MWTPLSSRQSREGAGGEGERCADMRRVSGAMVPAVSDALSGGEVALDDGADLGLVEMVSLHARSNVRHHGIGITGKQVAFVRVLVLDAEGATEDGQIVLDAQRPVGFETAEQALAAVVHRR